MNWLSNTLLSTAVFAISLVPTLSSANEIVLTLKDKDVSITGEFAGFQQNAYLITTDGELLNVPAKFVNCEGDSCLIIVSSNDQE